MSLDPADTAPPRPGRGNLKRAAIAALLIVLLTATTVASAALLEVSQLVDIVQRHGHKIAGINNVLQSVDGGGPQTILVIGSDKRYKSIQQGAPARSDTIILARLDPDKGATAVLSIPRDLKVTIPGGGIGKINAAYSLGGAKKVVETVKQLTGLPITHVMEVNFGGFSRAVNRLGCVYTDVDRRYYHSNAGLPATAQYAEIDIKPGYQKLCGSKSLDYVRYRHTDSDPVRSARQQDFLRQAKTQFSLSSIFGNRKQLVDIFSRYTATDLSDYGAILKLLKLAFLSSKKPIREVKFSGIYDVPGGSYLDISAQNLAQVVDNFRNVRATSGTKTGATNAQARRKAPRHHRKRARQRAAGLKTLPAGMIFDKTAGENVGTQIALKLRRGLPVYYPAARLALGGFRSGERDYPAGRAYTIRDRSGKPYDAYRIVLQHGDLAGQYYGVQGTSWKSPPLLDGATSTYKTGGRTFELLGDGDRLRLVAWRTPHGTYWVSNTLSQTLTNKQLIAIARSLTRLGS